MKTYKVELAGKVGGKLPACFRVVIDKVGPDRSVSNLKYLKQELLGYNFKSVELAFSSNGDKGVIVTAPWGTDFFVPAGFNVWFSQDEICVFDDYRELIAYILEKNGII